MKRITRSLLLAFAVSAFLILSPVMFISCGTSSNAQAESVTASQAMRNYLEQDTELMALMEKSIAKAQEINPDINTNPVRSVENLYEFIDMSMKGLPWNLLANV